MRNEALVGHKVADRFTIQRYLGEGGMATVYVAEQAAEPRLVALKIMNEDLTTDRTFVHRFRREAQAASRVQHPNSVQIIEYGVAGKLPYIAMELLTGSDLYVLLERSGAITQGRAARILIEVCDVLSVAHELGIVHRDLKPENIMVIADPRSPSGERVKVLDFGIAKLLASDAIADERASSPDQSSAVTRAGTFIGTPAYMSPEQCGLLPVDTRADIYTCGVLLFQLVTGRLPFEGQTPLHTATLHIHQEPPRPSAFAPGIDPRLEAIILKALAKKPAERQPTARHLGESLRRILPDLRDVAVAVGPISKRPQSAHSVPPPASGVVSSAPKAEALGSAKTMVADVDADSTPAAVRVRAGRDSDPTTRYMPPKKPAEPAPEQREPMPTLQSAETEMDFGETQRAPATSHPDLPPPPPARIAPAPAPALVPAPAPAPVPLPAGNPALFIAFFSGTLILSVALAAYYFLLAKH